MRCTEKWEKLKQTKKILEINKCLPNKSKKDWKRRSKKASRNSFKMTEEMELNGE